MRLARPRTLKANAAGGEVEGKILKLSRGVQTHAGASHPSPTAAAAPLTHHLLTHRLILELKREPHNSWMFNKGGGCCYITRGGRRGTDLRWGSGADFKGIDVTGVRGGAGPTGGGEGVSAWRMHRCLPEVGVGG